MSAVALVALAVVAAVVVTLVCVFIARKLTSNLALAFAVSGFAFPIFILVGGGFFAGPHGFGFAFAFFFAAIMTPITLLTAAFATRRERRAAASQRVERT